MMKRVVAPMIGGLASSLLPELIVHPPLDELWKRRSAVPGGGATPATPDPPLSLE